MIPHTVFFFNPQVAEIVARLCLLTFCIDFNSFDRSLSLAIDRLTVLWEAHQ